MRRRSAAHNIVHDQLHHKNYRLGRVQLRRLLDLAMFRAKYESMIDWAELDHRFCSVGKGAVLATYLEFAEVLLGQTTPSLSHAPRTDALAVHESWHTFCYRSSTCWRAVAVRSVS
jgi:hypothetical protein